MTTLTIASTTDFSADNTLNDVSLIDFTNPLFSSATATFVSTQFDGTHIRLTAAIDGSAGTNRIVVNMAGTFMDASAWTFTHWGANDTITFNAAASQVNIHGSSQKDIINGSALNDLLTGGGGADTVNGGAGSDQFNFAAGDIVSGETVDGGTEADLIQVGDGSYDFSIAAIANVENFRFLAATNSLATFSAGQVGGGTHINSVTGSGASDIFTVFGEGVDLSGVAFTGWTVGTDAIFINAGEGATLARGSGQDDIFNHGLAGEIGMHGGEGNDIFRYTENNALGDALFGEEGDGDAVQVVERTVDFTGLDLFVGVERIVLEGSSVQNSAAIFTAAQLAASGVATIEGNAFGNTFIVSLSGVVHDLDLNGLKFVNWTNGGDVISISGDSFANVITGNKFIEGINGGGGDDTVIGSAGGDFLDGGSGTDTLSYAKSKAAVLVDLNLNTASGGFAEGDTIANFENLTGGKFDDTLSGGTGISRINGGGGNDKIDGVNGNDILLGQNGDDKIGGGAGADSITGGGGKDTLTGGSEADFFIYNALADTAVGSQRDVIKDFQQGLDRVNLQAVDAIDGGNNDTFTFIADAAFSNTAGELRFFQTAANTIAEGDTNGDGAADFQIAFTGLITLGINDFVE